MGNKSRYRTPIIKFGVRQKWRAVRGAAQWSLRGSWPGLQPRRALDKVRLAPDPARPWIKQAYVVTGRAVARTGEK